VAFQPLAGICRDALRHEPSTARRAQSRAPAWKACREGLAHNPATVNATAFTPEQQYQHFSFAGPWITGQVIPDSNRQGTQRLYRDAYATSFQLAKRSSVQRSWVQGGAGRSTFGRRTQDLIVRVAQAYFDVLASQDSLTFIQAQKVAISERSPLEAEFRGRHGQRSPIRTKRKRDTTSQRPRKFAAQGDLEIKKRTLQQIVGKFPERLSRSNPMSSSTHLKPNSMEEWASAANQGIKHKRGKPPFEIRSARDRAASAPGTCPL